MHHIVNNLWLGSQHDADELVRNNPEEITAILNVRGADAYYPPGRDQAAEHPGKAYKWIPAPDIGTISPQHVREALLWLREQTDKREQILIHCKHGISRSPAFLAAFMVESGISPSLEEAKATISVHRPVQAPQIVEHVKPVSEMEVLTSIYLAPMGRVERAPRPTGRAAILGTIKEEFTKIGVLELIQRDVDVERYTGAGDLFRVDFGYKAAGVVKMFHGLSIASNVDPALALLYRYSLVATGMREEGLQAAKRRQKKRKRARLRTRHERRSSVNCASPA